MISASVGDSTPAAPGTNAADAGVVVAGVIAATNMPRSNAAVLTFVSTPCGRESCVLLGSVEDVEVPVDEGDSGVRGALGSSAIEEMRPGRPIWSRTCSAPAHDKATTAAL